MQQQKLFSKIFNIAGTETEAKTLLDSVLNEHPYFGLAQFYSLKNSPLSAVNHNEVAAKTNLFFNDTFFLNAQLLGKIKLDDDIYHKPAKNNFQQAANEFSNDNIVSKDIEVSATVEKVFDEMYISTIEKSTLHKNDPIQNTIEPIVKEPELLFEPLHASDYFASQGIKLSESAMEDDKLGKQLKSFTAWLKTMKKVHPDKLPAVTTITETAVQTQAEKSNIEEKIVTEPMAEAYIQQNKYTKAIEIYSKLSLINPAKSAYFAAKIDFLKK